MISKLVGYPCGNVANTLPTELVFDRRFELLVKNRTPIRYSKSNINVKELLGVFGTFTRRLIDSSATSFNP